jgi:glycosyltransferase involved in cell wall biosynthesis
VKDKKEKTILYIVTKSNWGGAQRYVYDLALAAAAHGHTAIVACGGEDLLTERLAARGIAVTRIPSLERDGSIFKDLRSFFEIMRIIYSTRPAVVHVNSSKAGGIGALAARICSSTCIVFTVHGLPQNEVRFWLSKKIIALLTWLTAVLSHQVIAVTNGDVNYLQKKLFLRKKTHYIQNGIEHRGKNRDVAREILLRYISDTNAHEKLAQSRWIGTVAELTHNKGHRYALQALVALSKRYPNIAYIIVGDGELLGEYKLFVQEHDLENYVFFTGFIPDAAQLYSAFDIYLASSVKEGLPYSILEAMASGKLVVASACPPYDSIVQPGVNGVVVPNEPQAFAEAIMRILADPAFGARLGQMGRRTAADYPWGLTVTQTAAFLERLLGRA